MVMNYEDISDFEINQAVTCELFGCHEWSVNQEGAFYHCGADGSGYFIQTVADYCNNQSYSWPIIIDSKIAVLPWNSNGWQSFVMKDGEPHLRVWHKNPLRAAMTVFLMMRGEQK